MSLTALLGKLFVFWASIPWFGLPMFDSQPFPLIVAVLFLIFLYAGKGFHLGIPKSFALIGLLFFLAIGLGSLKGIALDFFLFRGLANYAGIAIFLFAFYQYLRRYGFPLRLLVISNLIWLLVGIIHVYYPDFLTQFVPSRTSFERGVTSLAPEPSFFGIYLFFSSWLILLGVDYQPGKRLKGLLIANIMAIFVLAQSAMVVIYLVLATGAFILSYINLNRVFRLKNIGIFVLILVSSYLVYTNFVVGTRMNAVIGSLLNENTWRVLQTDVSINTRLSGMVLPVHGFFYNYGMPGGFHSYSQVAQEFIGFYGNLFFMGVGSNKLMSWNGPFFYELGIFAVAIWGIIFYELGNGSKRRRLELLLLFTILFSAVPLAFPLVPIILSLLYFKNKFGLPKRHVNTFRIKI